MRQKVTDLKRNHIMNKLISVIVPVYNTAPYLERCVNSILAQTYAHIEIILINDGSTDNSMEIIENLATNNKNIKYFNLENNYGLSYARNIGIESSEGDYIGFVDSDDWIEITMYEKLFNAMQKYNTKISSARFYNVKEVAGKLIKKHIYEMTDFIYFNNTEDMLYYFIYYHDVMVTNKLFSRSLFDSVRFPVGKVYEDTYILPRLLSQVETGIALDDELYARSLRNGSITHSLFNIRSFDYINNIIDRYQYITSKYNNTQLEQLCRKYIFETLMDLTLAVNPPLLKQDSIMLQYYMKVYHFVFANYLYSNCGLSKKQHQLCEILSKNIQNYIISRSLELSCI